ncbi:MAG: D-alanine--D-alanine ligase [Mesorhizobium sp.]|uniref:D-alanine--D-alanine ligase family protein n=1 Tax=Mesorhizobium sp. TaxID=1871066 RepID=UPI000FE53EC6|nr:MAG: D-alanine--D-alanine ligase [Mesorhizobium sp.]
MRTEVSFIFGGISMEYDSSVSSLENIISTYLSLSKDQRPFDVRNIHHVSNDNGVVSTVPFNDNLESPYIQHFLSGNGIIHKRPLVQALDEMAFRKEYIVNLLHGQFGEDGGIQTLAALLGLKGTFGDPQVASLTMNKYAMSSFVSSLLPGDIAMVPKTRLIRPTDRLDEDQITRSFQRPIVVKPNSLGSSLLTERFHEPAASVAKIIALINEILEKDSSALVQEFVPGREYSCGCLIGIDNIIPLPVAEIKTEKGFFGRNEKSHRSKVDIRLGEDDNTSISDRVKSVTKIIAAAMNLCNTARFDFISTHRSEIVFLECNYIPGMGRGSIFPAMLERSGMSVIDMIYWVVSNSKPYARKRHLVDNKMDIQNSL